MPELAIPVRCPKCGTDKIYKPYGGTLPDMPRSPCGNCGYVMYVRKCRLNSTIPESDGNDILPPDLSVQRASVSGASSRNGMISRIERPVPEEEEPRYDRIDLETVHDLLLRWANGEDIDSQLVRYCIDYCKGFGEEMKEEEDLDLERFRQIGEITEDSRSVQPTTEGEI